jgi:NAD dependent epimerase/dehydratase family enzyme
VIKAIFGEMAVVVLEGSRVSNHRIKQMGYSFLYPSLETAIRNIMAGE